MVTQLPPWPSGSVPAGQRNVTVDDSEELAHLMLDAYTDTVDDSGETIADARDHVAALFAGEFGIPLLECSFVAVERSPIVACTLVTRFEDRPLLAQVFTAKAWQRRGLASALIRTSMAALEEQGERQLALVVTVGNEPAESLYVELGFQFEEGHV